MALYRIRRVDKGFSAVNRTSDGRDVYYSSLPGTLGRAECLEWIERNGHDDWN